MDNRFRRTQVSPTPFAFTEANRAQLVVQVGKNVGHTYDVTSQRVTVGRDPENQIPIDDDRVSRFHAVLELKPLGYELRDLASTNGSMVNGETVDSAALRYGDVLRFGSHELRYLVERAKSAEKLYEVS